MSKASRKPLPKLATDTDAETFVDGADLTAFDLSTMKPARFELRRKDRQLNLRVSDGLLSDFKAVADSQGVPYQRLIRDLMEKTVTEAQTA